MTIPEKVSSPGVASRFFGPFSLGPLSAFACWIFSFVLRCWMSRSLHGSLAWACQGACRDAVPAIVLAVVLFSFQPVGGRKTRLSLLMTVWIMALLFLGVSDGIYFAQCGRRLDSALIENLSLTSLAPAETSPVITAVIAGLLLLVVLGVTTFVLARRPRDVRKGDWGYRIRIWICVGIIFGAAVPWARAVAPSPSGPSEEEADESLGTGQVENVAGIAKALWDNGILLDRPRGGGTQRRGRGLGRGPRAGGPP